MKRQGFLRWLASGGLLVLIGLPALSAPYPGASVIAHRGDSGAYPENTLTAFRAAIELPVMGVEFDVQMTKDGKLVLFHDKDLLSHTDFAQVFADRPAEEATIRKTTYSDLLRLDVGNWKDARFRGERVPTLKEALEVLRGHCVPVIELKEADIGRQVAQLVQELGMESDVIAISFLAESIRDFREVLPAAATGLNIGRVEIDDGVERARAHARLARVVGANALIVHHENVEAAYLATLRARGVTVWSYTINEAPLMDEKLARGLDGVITDVPRLALDVLGGRKSVRREQASTLDVVARPARKGKRVPLRAGEIPVADLARFLSDYTGLPLVYNADAPGLREQNVIVTADVAEADYDLVKALLASNGMLLEERRLAGGRTILSLDPATRGGGPVQPAVRPVVVVGDDGRPRTVKASLRGGTVVPRVIEPLAFAGLTLGGVPEAVRAQTDLQKGWGVLVLDIAEAASRAAEFSRLERFDIITSVDGKPIDDPEEFVQAIQARRESGAVPREERLLRYQVVRSGGTKILSLR